VPAFVEHPLYKDDEPRPRGSTNKFTMFSSNKDPFFFHYCKSLGHWSSVAVFDTGLIVFSEEFPTEDSAQILKYDVNYVLYKQYAWPIHWCIGTSVVTICNDWHTAQQR
jgi:hypothetical protein